MTGYTGDLPRKVVWDNGAEVTCICNRERRCAYHGRGGIEPDDVVELMHHEPVTFLTPTEQDTVDLLAQVMLNIRGITEDGRSREGDLREAGIHIHALQNMILANAAARAYPRQYRVLGGTVD